MEGKAGDMLRDGRARFEDITIYKREAMRTTDARSKNKQYNAYSNASHNSIVPSTPPPHLRGPPVSKPPILILILEIVLILIILIKVIIRVFEHS